MGCGIGGGKVTPGVDDWLAYAARHLGEAHGVIVNVDQTKHHEDLLKFGRHANVQTTDTTLMTLPTGLYNETFVADNLINSVISTDAGDTTTIIVHGHSVVGTGASAVYTEVNQTITLTGQTAVPLPTPLARIQRAHTTAAVALLGTVSFTETDTYAAGVPNTPAKVHMQIRLGQSQTEKAQFTTADGEWFIVTEFTASCLEKSATFGSIALEQKEPGQLFLPVTTSAAGTGFNADVRAIPYIVIHPNTDVRLIATAGANDKDFSGTITGIFMAEE